MPAISFHTLSLAVNGRHFKLNSVRYLSTQLTRQAKNALFKKAYSEKSRVTSSNSLIRLKMHAQNAEADLKLKLAINNLTIIRPYQMSTDTSLKNKEENEIASAK